METLRPQWSSITDEPFREPAKNLLNPVVDIEEGGLRQVYDPTIEGEPNFLVSGDRAQLRGRDGQDDRPDRSSINEAMVRSAMTTRPRSSLTMGGSSSRMSTKRT